MAAIDLTGQRFGRLTAVERTESDRRGNSRWLCQCDCGRTSTTYGFSLRSGHVSSCGCVQREWARSGGARTRDIAGLRSGLLVAIERVSRTRWSCLCDCGNTTIVKTNKLTSGATRSCGCLLGRLPFVTYQTLHKRLAAAFGPAAARPCVDCGDPAAHWSYDYSDPDELVCDQRGSVYSLDLTRYVPRCASCHKQHDLQFSRSA